MKLKGK